MNDLVFERCVRLLARSLLVVLGTLAGCSHSRSEAAVSGVPIVARINGEPVELGEFEHELAAQRATVSQEFKARHRVDDSPSFWLSTYGGERPIDELRTRALSVIVERKVQQALMKRHGVLPDTTYTAFLARWRADNERRGTALQRGERIYGPPRLSEDDYAAYEFSNSLTRTKELLAAGELKPSPDSLRRFYERNKDRLFAKSTVYQLTVVSVPLNASTRASRLREVRTRVSLGENPLTVAQEISGASVTPTTLTVASYRELHRTPLEKVVAGLSATQVSDVFVYGNVEEFVRCDSREPQYVELNEAEGFVIARYVDDSYESLVKQLVGTAHIEVLDDIYKRSNPSGEGTSEISSR